MSSATGHRYQHRLQIQWKLSTPYFLQPKPQCVSIYFQSNENGNKQSIYSLNNDISFSQIHVLYTHYTL